MIASRHAGIHFRQEQGGAAACGRAHGAGADQRERLHRRLEPSHGHRTEGLDLDEALGQAPASGPRSSTQCGATKIRAKGSLNQDRHRRARRVDDEGSQGRGLVAHGGGMTATRTCLRASRAIDCLITASSLATDPLLLSEDGSGPRSTSGPKSEAYTGSLWNRSAGGRCKLLVHVVDLESRSTQSTQHFAVCKASGSMSAASRHRHWGG